MTISANEIGKQFVYDVVTDLSVEPFTIFTLNFHAPDGEDGTDNSALDFTRTNPDVTAPGVSVDTPEEGTLEANTYLSYLTDGTDFVIKGDWLVCSVISNAGGTKVFSGPERTLTILEGCAL